YWSQEPDDTGDYSFVVWKPTVSPTAIPITFGESKPGAFVNRGDVVTYQLDVTPDEVGKPVSIIVSARNGEFYAGAALSLYDPDGRLVASVSKAYYYLPADLDDVVPAEAGTYTIRVQDDNDYELGSFTI